jgi:hypothetical protein
VGNNKAEEGKRNLWVAQKMEHKTCSWCDAAKRAPQKLPPPAERENSKGVSKEEVGAAMRRGVIGIQKYN